ncbi:NAD-dependent epimerase/dehydratase family protein [Laspinema palackyanum]|uniref:NAD-dependent epimerase/dehydratase family protein n=1 Tax=Laspinema palackyanum TaxID=3231601 RepID=UPI00345D65C9|nr:NAD(P)-dependent oxidoreductase [Laspinema sp. D2c]
MQTFLITGATGFIGTTLRKRLIDSGYKVVALTRNPSFRSSSDHVVVDLRDRDALSEAINCVKPHVVFHLAADKTRFFGDYSGFKKSVEVNLLGTMNLVESCLKTSQVNRFIMLGTCEEYGNGQAPFQENQREMPISSYSYSKTAATHLLQTLHRTIDFPAVILRPTIVYGAGQGRDMFLPALIESLLSGQVFKMTHGNQSRDYIYINDLVEACCAAIESDVIGQVINIGSGRALPIREIALLAAYLIGNEADKLLDFGALPERKNEIRNYSVNLEAATQYLRWRPQVSLVEGLRLTIESYRKYFYENSLSF